MANEVLVLDELFPPSPGQLVDDMRAAGATAVLFYVLRRDSAGNLISLGGVTAAHVAAARAAGFGTAGIVVPGNHPAASDPDAALAKARAFGIPQTALIADLEQFSFPDPAWVAHFGDVVRRAGWLALRYGDVVPLRSYPTLDGDWVSHGAGILVRAGTYRPAPAVPAIPGIVADQYAVQVVIGGHGYDVSVAKAELFGDRSGPVEQYTGGASVGATTAVIRIGGTLHTLDLTMAGDLIWTRTTGGAGGQVHAGAGGAFWNMGGTGVPGGIRDFAAVEDDFGQLVIRAKFRHPGAAFAESVGVHPVTARRPVEHAAADAVRSFYGSEGSFRAALHAEMVTAAEDVQAEQPGLVLGLVLDPNAQTQAAAVKLGWFQYDNGGPFRLPDGAPGPKGAPGPDVRPQLADALAQVGAALDAAVAALRQG